MDISIFSPIPSDARRAPEAICDQISSLITRGTILPGDRLPSERNLMEIFDRSRPTIREALRLLERNGLIRIVRGSSGAIVIKPSPDSVELPLENMLTMQCLSNRELLEYRELNEIATAGWAAERRSEEDLHQIWLQLENLDPQIVALNEFIRADIAFHQSVANASHNRISTIVDGVMHQLVVNCLRKAFTEAHPLLLRKMMAESMDSHMDLYRAIKAQDVSLAKEIMCKHMQEFEQKILSIN